MGPFYTYFNGVLTRYGAIDDLFVKRQLTEGVLGTMARQAVMIVVGAYDGEGYLIVRKKKDVRTSSWRDTIG